MRIPLYKLYRGTEHLKILMLNKTTPCGRYLLILVVTSIIFGLNTQATMLYQLAALLVAVCCVSFPLSFIFSPRISISREMPEVCTVGENLSYTIQLHNKDTKTTGGLFFREETDYPLPSPNEFLTTSEHNEEKRNKVDRWLKYYRWQWLIQQKVRGRFPLIPLQPLLPGKGQKVEVFFSATKRGYLHLKGYSLARSEPLGLFKKELFFSQEHNILVLPKTYPISNLNFEGPRKYHQGGLSSAAKFGDSEEFIALREYQAGDSIRHIDWKATAKMQNPILRQYQDEYFSRHGIILDTFTHLSHCPLFEEAISIAASIVIKKSHGNMVIDLLFAGNTFIETTTMGKGLAEQHHMLEILACMNPCREKIFNELTNLVKSHTDHLSGALLIFIDMDEKRLQLIRFFQALAIPFKAILVTANTEKSKNLIDNFEVSSLITVIDINRDSPEVLLQ